jgi:hypothetical protein
MAYAKSDSPYPFQHLGGQNYGVGHFVNETCDDITISCSYVPHPSFYHLKKAYEIDISNDLLTKDTFIPSKRRVRRSRCPSDYPLLADFQWKADKTKSLNCPYKSQSNFICPKNYKTLLFQEEKNTPTVSKDKDAFALVVVAMPLLSLVVLSMYVYTKWLRKTKTNIDGTWSFSDESVSLLSLKEYAQAEGIYQALSSDSSSGDLLPRHQP